MAGLALVDEQLAIVKLGSERRCRFAIPPPRSPLSEVATPNAARSGFSVALVPCVAALLASLALASASVAPTILPSLDHGAARRRRCRAPLGGRAGAPLVNMSFGVRSDRDVLRAACAETQAAGAVLVAAVPARGPAVFPASYPGVIRISGDARCAPGEVSFLGSAQADFGACPRTNDGRIRGASAAVAQLTGKVAAFLAERPGADAVSVTRFLDSVARYRGPERRTSRPAKPASGTTSTLWWTR